MKNVLMILVLILVSGCSTSRLAWKPAADKDEAKMIAESRACLVMVAAVQPGKFGNRREQAYLNCMAGQGHQLVEVSE